MNIVKKRLKLLGNLNYYVFSFLVVFIFSIDIVGNAIEEKYYIISPGDSLLITVVDHEKELTALVKVRPDGKITYDIIGDVKASGLTIPELSELISKKLSESGYYENPRVTVQLREIHQEIIYVYGDVVEPGQKSFAQPASIIETLGSAGGYKETADLANSKIIRKTGEVIFVDLNWIKSQQIDQKNVENALSDVMLKDGDALIVPSTIKDKQVSVIGSVNKPGLYQVRSDISIIEALALAGGALEKNADLKHINVISGETVTIVDATANWSQAGQNLDSFKINNNRFIIHPGDSIFVPEKGKISILGIVENQGQFSVDGEISILEALSLAGIKEESDLKRLRIVKYGVKEFTLDASQIWKHPERYADKKLNPGEILIVPSKPFRINWGMVSTIVILFSTIYAMFR